MVVKFLAVLVLIACFAQAQANPNLQLQPLGVSVDQAQNIIGAIQKLATNLRQNAINAFNQLTDQIQGLVKAAEDAANEKIQEVIVETRRQIQVIVNRTKQVGADISECIAQNEDSFTELREDFIASEIGCINNEVEEALEIIAEALAMIQDTYDSIQQLPGRLQTCGTGLQSMPCISKIIAEAGQVQLNLPISTAGKVAEVTQFIGGLKGRLEICAASQLLAASLEASKIVAEVSKCAAEKTEGHH